MRVALYARVSSTRQKQTQTIEQQLTRLQAHVTSQSWQGADDQIYRDDGYSGASLSRPGLDRLRDRAALGELDVVLITAPDRLARKYVHQVLLIEELEHHGCRVEFLDRPMTQDPHDQLVLQIRGAVAEYERTLITQRMRRGRLMRLRAGQLLPWSTPPFGYRVAPEHPRDPAGVQVESDRVVLVQQIFAWYLEPEATLFGVAQRLTQAGIPTPFGKPHWSGATVRRILQNPVYTGLAYANRTQTVPARQRKSPLAPVGPGGSQRPRPPEEGIPIPVPAIVSEEVFDLVQEKLSHNQQGAARNNTVHDYLLRALVSCGGCHLSARARNAAGYPYYLCRGRTDSLRAVQDRCKARYIPAKPLDELVWQDLCAVLTEPAHLQAAFERAHSGQWLPQELQARQTSARQANAQLERQQQRLLEAYLAEVLDLAAFERKRNDLARRQEAVLTQQRQLEALAQQHLQLGQVAQGLEAFCAQVRAGLEQATFAQRRLLVELLIDRVIVFNGEVEIR